MFDGISVCKMTERELVEAQRRALNMALSRQYSLLSQARPSRPSDFGSPLGRVSRVSCGAVIRGVEENVQRANGETVCNQADFTYERRGFCN